MTDRIQAESRTLELMVTLACRRRHAGPAPCPECRDLLKYAVGRLEVCPHGPDKPPCLRCAIHCYLPERRRDIRRVMRSAGPWMVVHHPFQSLRHLLQV